MFHISFILFFLLSHFGSAIIVPVLSLPQELDFLGEARNSEKCLDNFRKLSPHIADYVYAPKVYWNLSTSKLLTMEFMDGAQISDVRAIQRLGVQPSEVAKLVRSRTSQFCLFRKIRFIYEHHFYFAFVF